MGSEFKVVTAGIQHIGYAQAICNEMETSARIRGTGIARRSPETIIEKMLSHKAVIAFAKNGDWAGFCYISEWDGGKYVSNSGLIIAPPFRRKGLARQIKKKIFELSRIKFPEAKIFGLTTSSAVMKINSEMKYEPVIYSEITTDAAFWQGCESCVNHSILVSKERKNCLCTAMLFDPSQHKPKRNNLNYSSYEKQQSSTGL